MTIGSRDVVTAAIKIALTKDRAEERALQAQYAEDGILTAGVDFGGEFISSITKIIEW